MAIITTLCTEVTGVITRTARAVRVIAWRWHVVTHTPQPRQLLSSSCARRAFGRFGSWADTTAMASTGHAVTQRPQPLQAEASTTGR